jgi:hypothetical protein
MLRGCKGEEHPDIDVAGHDADTSRCCWPRTGENLQGRARKTQGCLDRAMTEVRKLLATPHAEYRHGSILPEAIA